MQREYNINNMLHGKEERLYKILRNETRWELKFTWFHRILELKKYSWNLARND